MKRWLALVLMLLLLPVMLGCGKKPVEPTKLPPSEPVEPVSEPTPQQESKVPPLADRLAGTYRLMGGEQNEESTDICILPMGGLLLVENATGWNNSVMSYWAQEIWPENALALQSDALELQGVNRCFSGMSNNGEYWDATADVIVTSTQQGVTFTDVLDDYRAENIYVRTENDDLLHSDLSFLQEQLVSIAQESGTGEVAQPAELVGTWCAADNGYAAWLHLGEDGALTYALKERDKPIVVLFGAWGVDENSYLYVQAERFGYGGMPYWWTLVYGQGNGKLRLTDIDGVDNFPLPPVVEPYFVPVEENWQFPAELFE